jgi:hypothetical protein
MAVRLERVNADGSRAQVALQDAGGANPGSLFRYDAALGGYIFNLSTSRAHRRRRGLPTTATTAASGRT